MSYLTLRAIAFKQGIVFFGIQLKQLRIVYLKGLGLKMQNRRFRFDFLIVLIIFYDDSWLFNLLRAVDVWLRFLIQLIGP